MTLRQRYPSSPGGTAAYNYCTGLRSNVGVDWAAPSRLVSIIRNRHSWLLWTATYNILRRWSLAYSGQLWTIMWISL